MINKIKTHYDHEKGNDEEQYRKLRQKVQVFQATEAQREDNDGITRGRVGIIMPQRNAFDFVEKP